MDAGINNVIYMELNSGRKIANSTCGKTIVAGTIDRGSTVLSTNIRSHTQFRLFIFDSLQVITCLVGQFSLYVMDGGNEQLP